MGAFFVIIIVVWAFCLNASFMQSVVNFDWPALSTIPQAFVDTLFVCSSLTPISPVLALFLVIGIVGTFKERNHLWITVLFIFVTIMYVACVATNGSLDRILTGFWYTDRFRISALLAIVQTLLIAFGLAKTYSFIRKRKNYKRPIWIALTVVLIVQTRRIMRQFFRKKSKILSIKRETSLEMLVCIIRPKMEACSPISTMVCALIIGLNHLAKQGRKYFLITA